MAKGMEKAKERGTFECVLFVKIFFTRWNKKSTFDFFHDWKEIYRGKGVNPWKAPRTY